MSSLKRWLWIFWSFFTVMLESTAILLLTIIVMFVGLFAVAIAIPFRKEIEGTERPFTQFPGTWVMASLPWIFRPWDNPCDGLYGDQRGWWDNECRECYGLTSRDFFSMYMWSAIRNSSNYWSRIWMGVDGARIKTTKLVGGECWSLLEAVRDDGRIFRLFEGKIFYPGSDHCLEWRFGWKLTEGEVISPDTPMADRYIGAVWRFRPWLNGK